MNYTVDCRVQAKSIYPSTLRLGGTNPDGVTIGFTNYYMEFSGKPFIAICGEFHYSRYPETEWEAELVKMKMSGINVIATYIFWNHHEEIEGKFDWQGNRNLREYVELCGKHGLYVILRIGPFCHGEARNGGLPDWLLGRPFEVRSNDEGYLRYVRVLYEEIGKQAEGLMFKDGGPVIGVQLENEFNAASALWEMTAKQGDEYVHGGLGGAEGIEHMRRLKIMAIDAGLVAPIYTSTGWGKAPFLEDEVLPLYGGYAYTPWTISANNPSQKPTGEFIFVNYHDDQADAGEFNPPYPRTKYPFACCEMGGGMQTWYLSRFQVEPESVNAMSMVKLAGGCNFIGYYMFHGGTNPIGKTGYMNESTTPKITYDFQAPIGEFGQIRASNHLLRPLHAFLRRFGDRLAPMATVLSEGAANIAPTDANSLRFAVRTDGKSGFLFINNYQDHVQMRAHDHVQFTVELDEGTLTFPRKTSLTVKQHAAMMLPLNFDLDGLNLRYATAQPVTALDGEGEITYFFAMPDGVDGEFAFEAEGTVQVSTEDGLVERDETGLITVVVKHQASSLVRIKRDREREIKLYVMSAEEAASFWEVEAAGKRRIYFSNQAFIAHGEHLELFADGQEQYRFREYKQGDDAAIWRSDCPDIQVNIDEDAFFFTYTVHMPRMNVQLHVERLYEHKSVIRFDPKVLSSVHDLLLRIDYTGNVGYAFSEGELYVTWLKTLILM